MEFWSPGSFFPKKIGPGDQYSMEFWSPGPIFHGILVPRTNFPVTEHNCQVSTLGALFHAKLAVILMHFLQPPCSIAHCVALYYGSKMEI